MIENIPLWMSCLFLDALLPFQSGVVLWLSVIAVSVIGELHAPGLFYFLSVACGAGIALGTALFCQPLVIQLVVFVCSSLIAFVLLRQFVVLHMKKQPHKTNSDALIGTRGSVVRRITRQHPGSVKLGGELWTARSQHHEAIESGEVVEVVAIVGCHAVVKKIG